MKCTLVHSVKSAVQCGAVQCSAVKCSAGSVGQVCCTLSGTIAQFTMNSFVAA